MCLLVLDYITNQPISMCRKNRHYRWYLLLLYVQYHIIIVAHGVGGEALSFSADEIGLENSCFTNIVSYTSL